MKRCLLVAALAASAQCNEDLQQHHRHGGHRANAFLKAHRTATRGPDGLSEEMQQVEQFVDQQLKQDNAPASLRKQEMTLLGKAESAARHAAADPQLKAEMRKQHSRRTGPRGVGQSVDKVDREIQIVEQALKKGGAPANLIRDEDNLLNQAATAAKAANRAQADAQLLRQQEAAVVPEAAASAPANDTEKLSANSMDLYVDGLAKMVQGEEKLEKTSRKVETQAEAALKETHASPEEESEVGDLLSKVSKFERSEVDLEKKVLKSSNAERLNSKVGDLLNNAEHKKKEPHKKKEADASAGADLGDYYVDKSFKEPEVDKSFKEAEDFKAKVIQEAEQKEKEHDQIAHLKEQAEKALAEAEHSEENVKNVNGVVFEKEAAANSEEDVKNVHGAVFEKAVEEADGDGWYPRLRSGAVAGDSDAQETTDASSKSLQQLEDDHATLEAEQKELMKENTKLKALNEERLNQKNEDVATENKKLQEANEKLEAELEADQ